MVFTLDEGRLSFAFFKFLFSNQILSFESYIMIKLPMSKKKLEELKSAFKCFDKDSDGTINARELSTVLRSVGVLADDAYLEKLMKAADTDGSGVVEFEEFLTLMTGGDGQLSDEFRMGKDELLEAFSDFDKDGNGQITKSELRWEFFVGWDYWKT